MKIINAKEASGGPNPHNLKSAQVYDSEHATVVHLTLEPGQSLKRHITPVDVFFYVLEGTGVVEVGDEKHVTGVNITNNWHGNATSLTNVSFSGANAFRLNNSTNSTTVGQSYVFDTGHGAPRTMRGWRWSTAGRRIPMAA